jgi:hypothetical protein
VPLDGVASGSNPVPVGRADETRSAAANPVPDAPRKPVDVPDTPRRRGEKRSADPLTFSSESAIARLSCNQ